MDINLQNFNVGITMQKYMIHTQLEQVLFESKKSSILPKRYSTMDIGTYTAPTGDLIR